MVYALVLSGGTGIRMGGKTPKQYLQVNNKPIIGYCLDTFQKHARTERIVIVAAEEWRGFLQKYIENEKITKFFSFAEPGISRQHSILSGLQLIKKNNAEPDDIVIIHDAARPGISHSLIDQCISMLDQYDCTMPVLPMKDTIYQSGDGKTVSALLERDTLFSGQAPEGVLFEKYYKANMALSDEELSKARGTSAIAFQSGYTVGLFPGDEKNYKITTTEDLQRFIAEQKA